MFEFRLFFLLTLSLAGLFTCGSASHVRELDEDNWKDMLEGEWMVEFYAPWCPACKALEPIWKELSIISRAKSTNLNVGAVDVTVSPALSGRFMVTALPTIFHVKDGVFRQYRGPRLVENIQEWIQEERWQKIDPISKWSAPDSLQMTLVGGFFKFSQTLRTLHTALMDQYGLPTWGSYLIFAIATIFIGAILGLLLVCVIDFLYPVKKDIGKMIIKQDEIDAIQERNATAQEPSPVVINDDIVDEDSQSDREEGGKFSQSDSQESEPEDKENTNNEVRKRRPRKAD